MLARQPYPEAYKAYKTEKEKAALLRQPSQPLQIANLLESLSTTLGLETYVSRLAVLRLWPKVAPPPWNTLSQAVMVKQTPKKGYVLVVAVPHATAATDLRFELAYCLQRLNQSAAQTGLTLQGIEVKVQALKP